MNTFDISVKKNYFLSWMNPFKKANNLI